MVRLGIGVITYNRKDILRQCVEKIRLFTRHDYDLVIADDGSDDGTPAMLDRMAVPYVTGENRGIAWNRNRALWWLKEEKRCDVIILFEDDCHPDTYCWEAAWIRAIEQYGHMNYMPEITLQIDNDVSWGSGTVEDPFIAPMHQAFCVGYHARAIDFVGYLDVRFCKYGEEHVEHTHRFLRAGYGGLPQYQTPERGQVFYLRGGLTTIETHTHGTAELVAHNVRLHRDIQKDPIYRAPWRDDSQLFLFREEMEAARSRPPVLSGDNGYDCLMSLGGDEYVSTLIEETFGEAEYRLFDGFITPFHSLVQLFETGFRSLFSTICLYPYHEALRCRDSLIIYHNVLKLDSGEPASIDAFHTQRSRIQHEAEAQIDQMDQLGHSEKRVLFVRDWRATLHYAGIHRPRHSPVPDFGRLVRAIEGRYPELDFRILFLNYGDAFMVHPRMIFANLNVPDVCDSTRRLAAWQELAGRLGIYLRGNKDWGEDI